MLVHGLIRMACGVQQPNQGQSATMKRYWLLFSQWVTVLVAIWFVVATLQPTWLRGAQRSVDGMTLLQAPPAVGGSLTRRGEHQHPPG
jgi:hypothetical protein